MINNESTCKTTRYFGAPGNQLDIRLSAVIQISVIKRFKNFPDKLRDMTLHPKSITQISRGQS